MSPLPANFLVIQYTILGLSAVASATLLFDVCNRYLLKKKDEEKPKVEVKKVTATNTETQTEKSQDEEEVSGKVFLEVHQHGHPLEQTIGPASFSASGPPPDDPTSQKKKDDVTPPEPAAVQEEFIQAVHVSKDQSSAGPVATEAEHAEGQEEPIEGAAQFKVDVKQTAELHVSVEDVKDPSAKNLVKELDMLHKIHVDALHVADEAAVKVSGSNELLEELDGDGADSHFGCQDYQRCARSRWAALRRMLACADVHHTNSQEYIQFHHMIHEARQRVVDCSKKAEEDLTLMDDLKEQDAILKEVKKSIKNILEVEQVLEAMFQRLETKDGSLVPVHLRCNPLEQPIPAVALSSYSDGQNFIREGCTLLLTDNSNPQAWKVKDASEKEHVVPSVYVLLPGPDETSLHALTCADEDTRAALKKLWKNLALCLLEKLTAYLPDVPCTKSDCISRCPETEQQQLKEALDLLEDTLNEHNLLPCCPLISKELARILQEAAAADLAAEGKDEVDKDKAGTGDAEQKPAKSETPEADDGRDHVIAKEDIQVSAVCNNLKAYDSALTEALKKAEDLGLKPQEPEMTPIELQMAEAVEESMIEEGADVVDAAPEPELLDVTVSGSIQQQQTTAETSHYMSSSSEMRESLSITGVTDTMTGEVISMADAIEQKILDTASGTYIDRKTGEQLYIPEAMGKGLIKFESYQVKQSREETQSVGILNVTVTKETRPYTVRAIQDPRTEEMVAVEEAVRAGFYKVEEKIIVNPDSGETITIDDGITCGAVQVDFEESSEVVEAQVTMKTLAVQSVLDHKQGKRINFSEAVKRSIINAEENTYFHNQTQQTISVVDALQKGFIKAKVVDGDDPRALEGLMSSRSRSSSLASLHSDAPQMETTTL